MFTTDVLNAEIVDSEAKLYRLSYVFPKARGILIMKITMFVKMFFNQFIGKEARLWKAIIPLEMRCWTKLFVLAFAMKVVLSYDFNRHVGQFEVYVFGP
jgi:hypothetical protein